MAGQVARGSRIGIIFAVVLLGIGFLVVPPLVFPPSEPTPTPVVRETPFASPMASADVSFDPSPYRALDMHVVLVDPDGLVTAMAVSGSDLVLAGSVDDEPMIWRSNDGGLGWTRTTFDVPSPPAEDATLHFRAAEAVGRTVVVTGYWILPDGTGDFEPIVFLSDDAGLSWRSTAVDASLLGPFSLASGTTDGFVGIGFDRAAGDSLWRSESGEDWVRLEATGLQSGFSLAIRDGIGVAAGPDFGGAAQPRPAIWRSSDLLQWETIPVGGEGPGIATIVRGFDQGYVVGGFRWPADQAQRDSVAVLWFSADGAGWSELRLTPIGGWQVSEMAANNIGVLAVLASTTRGTERQVAFVPLGTHAISTTEMPFDVRAVAPLGSAFVVAGTCTNVLADGCAGSYVRLRCPPKAAGRRRAFRQPRRPARLPCRQAARPARQAPPSSPGRCRRGAWQ